MGAADVTIFFAARGQASGMLTGSAAATWRSVGHTSLQLAGSTPPCTPAKTSISAAVSDMPASASFRILDCGSVHLGDPSTLRDLFRGELWRGRDNLRMSFRGPVKLSELPSAILPIAQLGLLGMAVTGIAAGPAGLPVTGVGLGGILVAAGARAARMGVRAKSAVGTHVRTGVCRRCDIRPGQGDRADPAARLSDATKHRLERPTQPGGWSPPFTPSAGQSAWLRNPRASAPLSPAPPQR